MTAEPLLSFAALRNRLVASGELVALTALRIGAGRNTSVIDSELPVLRDALGAPFVPGASLKGSLRSQVEALIAAFDPDQARDMPATEAAMRGEIATLSADAPDDLARTHALLRSSTVIDKTFGAPWLAGRVFVRDALVDHSLWFGQFEQRNGVALNRDTETAQSGLLYEYEVVPTGTRFAFELTIENAEDWQLGMLLVALQPWIEGRAQIGGFRSRGLGYVQLAAPRFRYVALSTPDDALRLTCDDATLQRLGISPPDTSLSDERRDAWLTAFRTELHAIVDRRAADAAPTA